MKKTLLALALALASIHSASAASYSGTLINENGLAISTVAPFDMQANGVTSLSAQATTSSTTFSAASFQDGRKSTGAITVVDNSGVSTAAATNQIVVLTTSGIAGVSVAMPGFVLRNGQDWSTKATTALTAADLKAALAAKITTVNWSVSGNVIYGTAAAAGALFNAQTLSSSKQSAIAVASSTFRGGQDAATLTIAGTNLRGGRDWNKSDVSSNTALSIRDAINNNAVLGARMTATASNAVVTVTSKLNGADQNFSLISSTPTALSLTGSAMTGGLDPDYALGGHNLTSASHGLTTGLAVLYATGTVPIGGLTNQTTYYAIRVDTNTFQLATSLGNALAGTYITFTSSNSATSQHTYTVTPLAFTGTASFKWQVSADASSWSDLSVSSVSIYSTSGQAVTGWNFGVFGFRYIRLNYTKPTTGGANVNVALSGSSTSTGTITTNASLTGSGTPLEPLGVASASGTLQGNDFAGGGRAMYSPSTGVMDDTTTIIMKDGAVGIGTTAPNSAYRLDVKSTGIPAHFYGGFGAPSLGSLINIEGDLNHSAGFIGTTGQPFRSLADCVTIGHEAAYVAYENSTIGIAFGDCMGTYLQIKNETGNVGIGTTAPVYRLEATGVVKSTDSIISSGSGHSGKCACYLSTGQLGFSATCAAGDCVKN